MSLLIKGMDMPKCCYDCSALDDSSDYDMCRITGRSQGYRFDSRNNKMKDCPLTPLPQKHGRLIEENDVLREIRRFKGYLDEDMIWRIEFAIKNRTKTIIEAED